LKFLQLLHIRYSLTVGTIHIYYCKYQCYIISNNSKWLLCIIICTYKARRPYSSLRWHIICGEILNPQKMLFGIIFGYAYVYKFNEPREGSSKYLHVFYFLCLPRRHMVQIVAAVVDACNTHSILQHFR